MAFDSDRTVRTDAVRAQMQTTSTPNAKVSDKDFAFLIQRADIPKDFKGIISTVYELGSIALKPYLDPLSSRLDEVEFAIVFEEADPVALEALTTAETALKKSIADRVTSSQLATELKVVTDAIADLDQSKADKTSVTALNTAIDGLNDLLTANDATDADIQAQLDKVSQAVEAAKTASGKSLAAISDEITQIKSDLRSLSVVEKDPVATAQVAALQTVVDTLPTNATLDPIKANVKTVQDQYKQLDTSKADKSALDAAQAAIKALQDALAALPPAGATPEQLKAVDDRVKALESAISKAENSKGILTFDARSHALVSGNLFGGLRRLISEDITSINERVGFGSVRPYAALNGANTTDMSNSTNQWLTWKFNQVRLWRIEITHTNTGGWANLDLKRNAVKVLDLTGSEGRYTEVYTPKTSTGHELTNSIQIVDDGGSLVLNNVYVSITDSANPALPPTVGGVQLKVGDRFRFNYGEVSSLYTYQGTDGATGAWKSTPVSASSDTGLARYEVVNPRLDRHDLALEGLENQVAGLGNMRIRRSEFAPQEDEIDGSFDMWIRYQPGEFQIYTWVGGKDLVTDGSHTIPIAKN